MKLEKSKISINTDVLKIVALVSMTIDHFARKVDFNFSVLLSDTCGRFAFPIFVFLLVCNLNRVPDKNLLYKKYSFRLLFTGVITLWIDIFVMQKVDINIMFSLFLIVAFVYFFERIKSLNLTGFAKNYLIVIVLALFAEVSLFVEYQPMGFFYGVMFYLALKNDGFAGKFYFGLLLVSSIFVNFYSPISVVITVITTTLLYLSKNYLVAKTRIIKKWWIFYLYYPLHRAMIALFF